MTTTREVREALRVHAISLHKLGWTQTAIAKETGVPRRTAGDWVGGKVRHAISTKSAGLERNGELAISSSGGFVPIFKSWCGRIEDFKPDDGIRFRIVLADPPWNISTKLGDFTFVDRNGKPHTPMVRDFGKWDAFNSHHDYLNAVSLWLRVLYNLAADDAWCWFWCSYRYLSFIIAIGEQVGWHHISWYAWLKTNSPPLIAQVNQTPINAIEPLIIFRKGQPHLQLNGKTVPNYAVQPIVTAKMRPTTTNVTTKPLTILFDIIQWSTSPGDWVLDAFAGSGSGSEAALRKCRNAYAVEADPMQEALLPHKAKEWLPT